MDPLLEKGQLPHFQKMMKEGASGVLLSILPPNSGGAWPSLVTGFGPGETGLLNFRKFTRGSREIVLADGRDLNRPSLWDITGVYQKKSVSMNEPMSYPPHRMNGVLVSGLTAPQGKTYTYPPHLSVMLDEVGYMRDAIPKGSGPFSRQSTVLEDYFLMERKRLDVALLFLESDWDLFFCMFPSIDRIMHHLERHFTRRDLDEAIIEMDRLLGVFMAHLPQQTTVFVVSDHGFHRYEKQFSIPRWLEREGYWVLPPKKNPKKTPLFRFVKALQKLKESAHLPDIPGVKWPEQFQLDPILPPVHWEETRAIAVEVGGDWGSIRMLQHAKSLQDTLRKKLLAFRNPETKRSVVKNIFEGSQIYPGRFQREMPDLVFQLDGIRADFSFHDQVVRDDPMYHHRQEGVLIAWGPPVKRGIKLPSSSILDVTPTALHLLDLPVSEELHGRVLEEAFIENFRLQHPIQHTPHYPNVPMEWVETHPENVSEDVKESLRSLGYLQ